MKKDNKSRPLDPMEQWMVRSNLNAIRCGESAEKRLANLRANGYLRVAAAVKEAIEKDPTIPKDSKTLST